MENQQADLKKIKDLISDIRIGTLVTHSDADGLRGRPMSTSEITENGELWFFTNEFTGKVDEISANNEVLVTYASPSDNSYVVVNGTASLVKDKAKMESLWNPALKAWFPEGLEDPQMMLLKVEPDEVEYWNGSSSKVGLAYNVVKAIIKGEKYSDGEHKTIELH